MNTSNQTVNEIINNRRHLNGQLSIRVSNDSEVCIEGTPDAFRALAAILVAQAEGFGSGDPSCSTSLVRGDENGVLLSKNSVRLLHLHCHQP